MWTQMNTVQDQVAEFQQTDVNYKNKIKWLKKSLTEMKRAFHRLINSSDTAEKRISELEDRSREITQLRHREKSE